MKTKKRTETIAYYYRYNIVIDNVYYTKAGFIYKFTE